MIRTKLYEHFMQAAMTGLSLRQALNYVGATAHRELVKKFGELAKHERILSETPQFLTICSGNGWHWRISAGTSPRDQQMIGRCTCRIK